MLNFTLATAFIFYIAATSWSSCSLVFWSKVVLRLALAHSKYTGNRNYRNYCSAMNEIPAFKFTPDSLPETSLFENDFI